MHYYLLSLFLVLMACSQPVRHTPGCMERFSVQRFLLLTDHLRASEQIPPLRPDPFLSSQAQNWADYNSRRSSIVHYDAARRGPLERLKMAGFKKRLVSENIAVMPSHSTEADILSSWKGKKEEQNVLNPLYQKVGLGLAPFKDGCVLVVLLTE